MDYPTRQRVKTTRSIKMAPRNDKGGQQASGQRGVYSTSDTKQLTAEKRRAGSFIPSFEERGRAASAFDFPSSLGVL